MLIDFDSGKGEKLGCATLFVCGGCTRKLSW